MDPRLLQFYNEELAYLREGAREFGEEHETAAQQLGLKPGDVLVKIAGEAQASVTDFARAFKRYRMANTVMLLVARDGRGYHVRLRV